MKTTKQKAIAYNAPFFSWDRVEQKTKESAFYKQTTRDLLDEVEELQRQLQDAQHEIQKLKASK